MPKYMKLMGLFMTGLMLAACGHNAQTTNSARIAVIRLEKAVQAHPEHARLLQGEKLFKGLVARREAQLALSKAQLDSLENLRGLKRLSEQTYLDAELRTELLEKEQLAQGKLMGLRYQAEKAYKKDFDAKRTALEEEYRLRIFNLRLEKDRAKTNTPFRERAKLPEKLAALDEEIKLLAHERGQRVFALEQEKQDFISARLAPKAAELHKEIQDYAEQKRLANAQAIASSEGKYEKMMAAAPEAITKALALMDKEIKQQQEKNTALQKQIDSDIESAVVRLAKQRGYEVVLKKFKINVSAVDITDDVIAEVKKPKDK